MFAHIYIYMYMTVVPEIRNIGGAYCINVVYVYKHLHSCMINWMQTWHNWTNLAPGLASPVLSARFCLSTSQATDVAFRGMESRWRWHFWWLEIWFLGWDLYIFVSFLWWVHGFMLLSKCSCSQVDPVIDIQKPPTEKLIVSGQKRCYILKLPMFFWRAHTPAFQNAFTSCIPHCLVRGKVWCLICSKGT